MWSAMARACSNARPTSAMTPGSFATGYGAGIHFLLPYSVVLRTEYAWNEYGMGQFIIDFRGNI